MRHITEERNENKTYYKDSTNDDINQVNPPVVWACRTSTKIKGTIPKINISFNHKSFLLLFPKIVKNGDWQVTFVLTFTPPSLNRFLSFG